MMAINSRTAPVYRSYRGRPSAWNSYFIVKRSIDVLVCLALIPLLAPLMGLIAVAIRIDSHGRALFTQERIGRRGSIFKIYKFRTMVEGFDDPLHRQFMQAYVAGEKLPQAADPDSGAPLFKPPAEQAYTRVGRVLRRLSIDELPQLINVLKGEMSLVGPRPNVPWEVEKYQLWHAARLDALPGITGLAQVNGRSALRFDEIARFDIYYVMRYSFWLDLKILFRTVGNVFSGHGAG
ncbi:MAG: sugar transferase [Chloroflexota bacterium]